MRVAYVAGPYRSDDNLALSMNITRARMAARYMWAAGYAVTC